MCGDLNANWIMARKSGGFVAGITWLRQVPQPNNFTITAGGEQPQQRFSPHHFQYASWFPHQEFPAGYG